MLRKLFILVLIAVVLGSSAFWVFTRPESVSASALQPHTPNLTNGQTMFLAGGCASCHAVPGQQNQTRLGGGLALKSSFGIFYAPNISPDRNDGIGAWSEANFVTAMVKGTSPDGRHYYPAFPYTSYQRMAYSDVRDLFAYLKTLPPVQGKVRDHDLPFPFNVRRLVGGWKFLFFDGESFQLDATKSEQWNRGAYLVNGPGHCAECHSPRNRFGAIVAQQRFAGGALLDEEGWVPNISGKRLGEWSESDFSYLLETGMTPDGDSVGSFMTLVVRNTAQLSMEDRLAMAVYLKSLPIVEGAPRPEKK
jgi:mono/diheme cytochrome c family protein